jgi:hypothetical protein
MLELTPVIITFIVFGAIVAVIRTFADHRVKMKYLEKGPDGVPVQPFDFGSTCSHDGSLKWGLVALFVGVAILVMEMLPRYFENEAILGGMFLAGGLALLLYYFIADAKKKRATHP